MESFPKFEKSLEEKIIESATQFGIESEEFKNLFNQWLDAKERWAAEKNEPWANTKVTLDTASLYRSLGLFEEAREGLEWGLYEAQQQREEFLYNQADALLEDMEREAEADK